jgi:hypothetical protein
MLVSSLYVDCIMKIEIIRTVWRTMVPLASVFFNGNCSLIYYFPQHIIDLSI